MSKTTIKGKLFKSIIMLSFAILISTSFFLSVILYNSDMSNINRIFKEKNIAIKYFIEGYFTKIHNNVEFLSHIDSVRNILKLEKNRRKSVLELYRFLQEADSDINYVYSGYSDGSLLINNYIPPVDYNSTGRPWYQAALKANPDISQGIPYREIKSKEWLISISKVLIDNEGKISGVISIDSSVQRIMTMLLKTQNCKYKSSNSLVTTSKGEIIIAQKRSLMHKNITDILGFKVEWDKKSGKFGFNLYGNKKYAYYTQLHSLGWMVFTIVDRDEIVKPIIFQILIIISVMTLMIFVFGWILSNSLSRQFVTPLIELRKRVHTIVSDNLDEDLSNIYPKDEIGAMASDIEQLARSELYSKNIELKDANEKLKLLSTTDSLTLLFNRRKMNIEIEKEFKRSTRYGTNFSLIMFDIDWFKKINDTYGHQAGDVVLKELSSLSKEIVRSTDIVSRWGGEEFLILCTETDIDTAYNLAQRLRKATENYKFSIGKKVTISIGVHEFNGKESIDEMLKNVDNKLYKAKHSGRNCVIG